MSKRFAAITCVIAALCSPLAAAGCQTPASKVCASYFNSDDVLVGTLIGMAYRGADRERIEYTVEVDESFKGSKRRVRRLTTWNDSARWTGELGGRYLFFASRGLIGTSCGPTDESEFVEEGIRQIRALRGATMASIEVEATANVAFTIEGPSGSRDVRLDKGEMFRENVLPGRYRLRYPGFDNSALGDRETSQFTLKPGQCAQFDLWPRNR